MNESPIFTRTHDLLHWLLIATRKFPREQRFVLATRLHTLAFKLDDSLTAAGLERSQAARHLLAADIALSGIRKTLLLCFEMQLLSSGQYKHVSEMVAEIGRLLGGWRKSVGG